MRLRSEVNIDTLTELCSKYELTEQESKVLIALYAHKSRAEEKEIQKVSQELNMHPAFVRHHHDYALQHLKERKCFGFSALFGTGEFLPSSRAFVENEATELVERMATVIEEVVAKQPEAGVGEIVEMLRLAPATGIVRELPRLSRFELLVLSLSYGHDGALRSKEAIADDLREAVKDDESLQERLITDCTINHAIERGSEKLRACGISVWHYFAQRLLELDSRQDNKSVPPSKLPEQMRIKVDAVLNSLRPRELLCLRFRCVMTNGRPLKNEGVKTLFAVNGTPIALRTVDHYSGQIAQALKRENINLWTVLLAEANRHSGMLVSKQ
jgi:hypothetical protein